MISAYSSFLGFRYLVTRWVNLLGMVGVAVGVWALIVVISVFSGFIHDIRANIRGASADVLVRDLPDDTSFATIEPIIAAVDGVVSTAPRVHGNGIYFPNGRMSLLKTQQLTLTPLHFNFVELIGVDPERERETTNFDAWISGDRLTVRVANRDRPFHVPLSRLIRHQRLTDGNALPTRQPPGILLPRKRSYYAALAGGVPIDVLSARFDYDVEPPKLRTMRRIFAYSGDFETKHRVFDEIAAMVHIDELRESLLAADPFGDWDLVNAVAVRAADGSDLDALADRVRTALGGEEFAGAQVLTWEEQNATFLAIVDQERGMMKLILFAVVLVAAFLIYATLHMMVTQKIRDIGILSSMGATRAGIRNVFLISGAVIAALGCGLGTLTGWVTATYLNEITAAFGIELFPREIYALTEVPCRLEAWWVVQVLIGASAISLFSAYLPARRAARMEPVRALSHF